MTEQLQHRSVSFEVKEVDEKTGTFKGYASVFDNVDSYGDVIVPGAFDQTLKEWKAKNQLPVLLWQHDMHEPIGGWTKFEADEHGLWGEGEILIDAGPTEKRAHAHLVKRTVRGLSIGFSIYPGGIRYDEERNATMLTNIKLWEVSVVTFPANDQALIEEVRSAIKSPRDFEKLLRGRCRLTRTEAKRLMAGGFKALAEPRDAGDEDLAEAAAAVAALTEQLKQRAA